jgi:hypothetical protein
MNTRITIRCPHCSESFTIELTAAKKEIELLQMQNARLRHDVKRWTDFAKLNELFGGMA